MSRPAWIAPEADAVAAAHAQTGMAVAPEQISLMARDDRFAVLLPGDRIAWFAQNAAGAARMDRERRVLALIARHCSFAAPRVIDATESWDLRTFIPGHFAPFLVFERAKADGAFANALGASIGRVLADQHLNVPRDAVRAWLPREPSWPEPLSYMESRLPRVTDDADLIRRALDFVWRYEAAETQSAERVLAHCDFGFHNIVVDDARGEVVGVFDYDGAAYVDRDHDFKYLLLDAEGDETLLRAAMNAYTSAGGAAIDRQRLYEINAASAVCFLAYRDGAQADEKPAGRTLSEDLAWMRMALTRAGA